MLFHVTSDGRSIYWGHIEYFGGYGAVYSYGFPFGRWYSQATISLPHYRLVCPD